VAAPNCPSSRTPHNMTVHNGFQEPKDLCRYLQHLNVSDGGIRDVQLQVMLSRTCMVRHCDDSPTHSCLKVDSYR
jgi:hypothetical protein